MVTRPASISRPSVGGTETGRMTSSTPNVTEELRGNAHFNTPRGAPIAPLESPAAAAEFDSKDPHMQEYVKALLIDKHSLDEMWVQQPDLYYQVSEQQALAMSVRDEAKLALDREEAETDGQIRSAAAQEGGKITESEIKRLITLDKDVIRRNDTYIKLTTDARLWESLQRSHEMRAKALDNLTRLFIAGYFTTASGAVARSEATDRQAAAGRASMAEARAARE